MEKCNQVFELFSSQEFWLEGRGGLTLTKITELPELLERPPRDPMDSNRKPGYRDRYERERFMNQRTGQRDQSRSGYGGKASYERGFIPDRFGGKDSYPKGFDFD